MSATTFENLYLFDKRIIVLSRKSWGILKSEVCGKHVHEYLSRAIGLVTPCHARLTHNSTSGESIRHRP